MDNFDYNNFNYNNTNYNNYYQNNNEKNGMTLGILSIIFGVFLPLIGLILGIVGINKSKKNYYNKIPKIVNIIGIIISILISIMWGILLLIILFIGGISGGFRSPAVYGYGNSSANAVIEDYWKALNDGDEYKAGLCFPYTATLSLDFSDTNKMNFYTNTIECVETTEDELKENDISNYNNKFQINFDNIAIYHSTCDFEIPSDPSYYSTYELKFIIGESDNTYYVLSVENLGEYYDNVLIQEPTEEVTTEIEETPDTFLPSDESLTEYTPSYSVNVKGNETLGYIQVPDKYIDFEETNGYSDSLLDHQQYAYGMLDIITHYTYSKEDIPNIESYAISLQESIQRSTSNVDIETATFGTYSGYLVRATYDDGTILRAFIFNDINENVQYICVEGLDDEYSDVYKTVFCNFTNINPSANENEEETTESSNESSNKIGTDTLGYLESNISLTEDSVYTNATSLYDEAKEYVNTDNDFRVIMYRFVTTETAEEAANATIDQLSMLDVEVDTSIDNTTINNLPGYHVVIKYNDNDYLSYYYWNDGDTLYHIEILTTNAYMEIADNMITTYSR